MGTDCSISKKTRTGYKTITCHWDGYPDHAGKILNTHYKDPKKVDKLIKLGHISSLGKYIGKKHAFNDNSENYVTAYGRDRGEKGQKAIAHKSLKDFVGQTSYNYVFEKGKWKMVKK